MSWIRKNIITTTCVVWLFGTVTLNIGDTAPLNGGEGRTEGLGLWH